jgi:hypothetical protein
MSTKTHHNQTSNEKEQQTTRVERKSQQQDQTFQPQPTEALRRVAKDPRAAVRSADILALQSSVGNRAVQRLVEKAQPSAVSPGVIQRHVSRERQAQLNVLGVRMQAAEREIRVGVRAANEALSPLITNANAFFDVVYEACNEPPGTRVMSPQQSENEAGEIRLD